MTDIERDERLDDLSSEELERQAFGPDPDAKRSLRGLIDRPAAGAVTYRVAKNTRRLPKVMLALAAALAVLVTGVAIGVDVERTAGPADSIVVSFGEDERARADALEAAADARAEAIEAATEAREEAIEAATEAREEALRAAEDARAAGR